MAARRKVDDRKTSMGKANAPVVRPPLAGIIRAAVCHRITACREPQAISDTRCRGDTYDAAHDVTELLVKKQAIVRASSGFTTLESRLLPNGSHVSNNSGSPIVDRIRFRTQPLVAGSPDFLPSCRMGLQVPNYLNQLLDGRKKIRLFAIGEIRLRFIRPFANQ
jgi:hypothetical protein